MGFGFDIGFIDHLYTQLVSTSNYSATVNITNSPQIHKLPTHPLSLFQFAVSSPAIPWQRLLTASRTEVPSSQPLMHNSTKLKVKVEVTLRLTVSQSLSLGVEPHPGLVTRYLLLFDSYGLVFVGCPL
jgi:hypothetical protein